jgi:hypothetical protein
MDDFKELVKKVWDSKCPTFDPIDTWQFKIILQGKLKAGVSIGT